MEAGGSSNIMQTNSYCMDTIGFQYYDILPPRAHGLLAESNLKVGMGLYINY